MGMVCCYYETCVARTLPSASSGQALSANSIHENRYQSALSLAIINLPCPPPVAHTFYPIPDSHLRRNSMKAKLAILLAASLLAAAPFVSAQDATPTDKPAGDNAMKRAADKTGHDTKVAADKTGHATKVAAKDTAKGTEKAADKTGHETKVVAKDTGKDTKKAADKTGHETKVAAKDTAKGTEKVAKKTGSGIKKGTEATGHEMKKAGEKTEDAVK